MIRTVITIDGMACTMCEAHVQDTIREHFSVKKVKASHTKGTAEVISEEPLKEEALRAALDPTGYRVLAVEAAEERKKGFSLFRK
jgi:Copper chaperone